MTEWINAGGRVALMGAREPRWAEAEVLVAEALQALESGAVKRAASTVSRALGIDPRNAVALHLAGTIARRMGRLDTALAALQHARDLAPDDHRVANDLGLVHQDLGRPGSALTAFEASLALAPDALAPAINHAASLLRLRRYHAAVEALRALAERFPADGRVLTNLAVAEESAGMNRQAARSVAAALGRDPGRGLLVATAARLERRAGQQDKARLRLERWLKDAGDTDNAREPCLFELGKAADAAGDEDAAVDAFRRAGRLRARRIRALVSQESARTTLSAAIARTESWLDDDAEDGAAGGSPALVVGSPGAGVGDLARALRARAAAVVIEESSPFAALAPTWPASGPDAPTQIALRNRYLALAAEHDRPVGARHVIDAASANLLALDRALTLFPRARVLLMVRHPADLLLAARTEAWEPNALGATLARDEDALALFESIALLARRLARRLGDRLHLLRAESLHADRDAAVADALRFFRIPERDAPALSIGTRPEGLPPGRWQAYGDWLSPWRDRLTALARSQGYTTD